MYITVTAYDPYISEVYDSQFVFIHHITHVYSNGMGGSYIDLDNIRQPLQVRESPEDVVKLISNLMEKI